LELPRDGAVQEGRFLFTGINYTNKGEIAEMAKTEAEMAKEKAAADAAAAALKNTETETDSDDNAEEMERLKAALKKANREAADRRKKLDAFEAAEAVRDAAALTELETAQKAATDAQAERDAMIAQVEKATIRHAVEMAAIELQFIDPSDAYALSDLSDVTVEDGKVAGVDDALKALKKSKPHLVKQAKKPNTDSQKHNTPAEADEAEKQRIYNKYGVQAGPS